MTWPDFEELWNKMLRFHLENEKRIASQPPKMSDAMKKFKELDEDKSQYLEGMSGVCISVSRQFQALNSRSLRGGRLEGCL